LKNTEIDRNVLSEPKIKVSHTPHDEWALKPRIPWNKGLTIQDPRVKKYTLSRINSPHYEEVKRKIGMKNSISLLGNIPHNKGKTKENYEPLRRASEKLKGRH